MAGGQGKVAAKGGQQKGKADSKPVKKNTVQSKAPAAGGKSVENPGSGSKGKAKEDAPKAKFYVKDGKNYSYKVPGSVEVGSVQEAEALMKVQEETIHGLGPGGNVHLNGEDSEEETSEEEELEVINNTMRGEASVGRGRGAGGPGRGRGRAYDKHHQKDRASRKHFTSLGGGY